MLRLNLTKKAEKQLRALSQSNQKHCAQVKGKIQSLLETPHPQDSLLLSGKKYKKHNLRRADAGEYRIIYNVTKNDQSLEKILNIYIVAKRNNSEVYKKLENLF